MKYLDRIKQQYQQLLNDKKKERELADQQYQDSLTTQEKNTSAAVELTAEDEEVWFQISQYEQMINSDKIPSSTKDKYRRKLDELKQEQKDKELNDRKDAIEANKKFVNKKSIQADASAEQRLSQKKLFSAGEGDEEGLLKKKKKLLGQ